MYNFDEVIDRSHSGCIKTEALEKSFGRKDLLPLWIADMDWPTPDFILDAIRDRLEHPILGYTAIPENYFTTISEWVGNLLDWKVDPSHIRYIPGIVKGIAMAQSCFLSEGDKVIIQPPVYHPFRITTENLGFEVVNNPLIPVFDGNGFVCDYEMDFDGLERLIDSRCRMLVLSNPHNPGGICWSRETLAKLAHICHSHGIIVVSDEIHGEMAFCQHSPFASVSPEAAECSISFLAPSKTFNIAGVVSSYCIIINNELRERLFKYIGDREIDMPCIFSIEATMAAYTKGVQWRREMMDYLKGNIDFALDFLRERIPVIGALRPQASFLIWLDCRKLALSQKELVSLFVDKAHLALNDGSMFGKEGEGFMRLNVACPRSILREALERLESVIAL